ncbi:crotonase/enoyl-CoA hydratase family protein [Pseudonocardia kujensis]|uniref:crotonase/enoyl-CoA hydratase family protein n=1 Tax=Pseudonocardia kujensis TaxID=1128675 RepID=UPI001E623A37|nr:crotonase/enoyl-CoA hydratase family protein [Pseudonocardia kujensis]MCE0762795.1 crotonase/enoyl-CoA hydratase family protein [Pseudonocardia kujensis]
MTEPVRVTVPAEGVLLVTLDRPEARNAVNAPLAEGVSAAMDRLDSDPDLRVGILTGAGGTFCAGADLKAFVRGERPYAGRRGFAGLVEQPPAKPLIAAVEGYALAGGCEIVLSCDLVVAAETATFGITEVKRGLVAAGGGLLRLPERIPYHVAMELALTGNHVPAPRMAELGLVNRLVPTGAALDAALTLAGEITANGPLAVRTSKRIIAESLGWPAAERWARQAELVAPISSSEDAREGATAFAEKRPPVWTGK